MVMALRFPLWWCSSSLLPVSPRKLSRPPSIGYNHGCCRSNPSNMVVTSSSSLSSLTTILNVPVMLFSSSSSSSQHHHLHRSITTHQTGCVVVQQRRMLCCTININQPYNVLNVPYHHRRNSLTLLPSIKDDRRRPGGQSPTFSTSLSTLSSSLSSSSSSSSSSIPFLLADIGEGIAEVELLQWFVQVGDTVQQFDRLCEVQSDKATVEITSRYDGTISSLEHTVGDMVQVGEPLLFIDSSDDDDDDHDHNYDRLDDIINNINKEMSSLKSSIKSTIQQNYDNDTIHNNDDDENDEKLHIPTIAAQYHLESDDDDDDDVQHYHLDYSTGVASINNNNNSNNHNNTKVLTSPAIRKLAKEYAVDLSTIIGTGPKGRVTKGDVLTVLKERGLLLINDSGLSSSSPSSSSSTLTTPTAQIPVPITTITSTSSPSSTTMTQSETPATIVSSLNDIDELPIQQDTTLKLRGYNRLMVQSMTTALQIPHMVYADELDLTTFLRYKKSDHKQQLGFLPFTIKAVSKALEKYPILNSSFNVETNDVTLWHDHNIGIAMDTPRGLVVPVLKQCQDMSIPQLADQLVRLKEVAMNGTISPDDLIGATFTLSNIGSIGSGGTYMSPVVTPPQVAIGAIGKIQRLPRFVSADSTDVQEAFIAAVSWGGDHRVIDGATMARFHSQVKEYIEDPIRLILEMR